MNLDIQGFVRRNLIPQSPPSPNEELPKGKLWTGWIVFFSTVILGMLLAFTGNGPWALIYLSSATLYFLTALNVVREPEVAILFSLGVAYRELEKGWWLTLWPFHEVEIETTARQVLHKEDSNKEKQDLYYIDGDRKIAIAVRMRVFLRLIYVRGALNTYGGLGTTGSRADIEATSFAALRSALGEKKFADLLKDKGKVERKIEFLTNAEINDLSEDEKGQAETNPRLLKDQPELARSGYIIESVDIYDYDERVQSEASRIKELAEAKAFEAGQTAKAVADPLRGNMPAAIAQSVATVATTFRDINRERHETRRRERKESEGSAAPSEAEGPLGKLQDLLTKK